MKDSDCVQFLQWALPRLHMHWPGFRKVRNQVCKRLNGRLNALKLAGTIDYKAYLESHPGEWHILDRLCRVTISRFYREKAVFQYLENQVLPGLIDGIKARGDKQLELASLGSASGEEPYTLALLWELRLKEQYPDIMLNILAVEADEALIQRSEQACYPFSSIRNLPEQWRERAFDQRDDSYCLHASLRRDVHFVQQDIRDAIPAGPFDLILCRNLAFTYFDDDLRRRVLDQISRALKPGGSLVIGIHEMLPTDRGGLSAWSERLRIFQKKDAPG